MPKKKERKITEAEYLAELEAVYCAKPPPGAFTLLELSRRYGIPTRTLRDRLEADVRRGLLKRAKYRTENGLRATYYWVADQRAERSGDCHV